MVAFLYRMDAGIPGDVNRAFPPTIEPQVITPFGTTGAPTAYGLPVVIDGTSGQVRSLAVADTAVYGILVRPFPGPAANDPLRTSTPPTGGACDVLVSGYISIKLANGTAKKGAPVYAWTAATSGPHLQGTYEGTNPTTNGIQVGTATTYFMGAADSNGLTEIAFNI